MHSDDNFRKFEYNDNGDNDDDYCVNDDDNNISFAAHCTDGQF